VFYSDVDAGDTHTALFTWDDGSQSTVACAAGVCTGTRTYAAAGVYGVSVVVSDAANASASGSFNYVVVYNANGGWVTGGGWIALTGGGKGEFSLSSKYNSGTLTGNVSFSTPSFTFASTLQTWLVVSGNNAQISGSGLVNGGGSYGYLLTATDNGVDKFRIKIWDTTTNIVYYDNVIGASDDIDAANPQPLGGGNIKIH
jgi:hypothetical protein